MLQCPSVMHGVANFTHEDCQTVDCAWWRKRCTAVDVIPVGRLKRRKACALASRCRWARQDSKGVCPPMRLGEICEHQGGTFNTSLLPDYPHFPGEP